MGKILTVISCSLLAAISLTSCGDSSCTESTTANAMMTFYSRSTSSALTIDSISVRGIGTDSILYDKSREVKYISVPLRINSNESAFQLNFYRSNSSANAQTDTVRFYHQNRPQYISPDCGCSVFYHIDSVSHTRHRIDTVKIKQPEITNQNEEHLQIYF